MKAATNSSEDALRLKAVIDTVIDGILTIDEKGIIETMNPAAAQLFGYQPAEVIGKNIKMLMPSPYRQEHDGYLSRYIKTNHPHIIGIGREVEGQRKDGSIFPLRLAVSEVILDHKRIFTGIIHDLTDVKVAEQKILRLNEALASQNAELESKVSERTEKLAQVVNQLLSTNKQLEIEVSERKEAVTALRKSEIELKELLEIEKELGNLKSRFVSMASHEFRTPLSTILSSIELVEAYKEAAQQTKREKHIERIKNAVNHLTSILNDFLSLSRLEEGHIQLEPVTFVFSDFCEEILEETNSLLKDGQSITHQGKNNQQVVTLDKKSLKHILFNLISNASKYSDQHTTIYCQTTLSQTHLSITVKDEGIGIPQADQKHLFSRFFRAHNVENIKGTGLGLHIVRQYIDLLNGQIRFESQEGTGTTFFIEIPLT